MPYITASGTIQHRQGNQQGQTLSEWWSRIPFSRKASAGLILAILLKRVLNPDPLANGYIPASKVLPEQQWQTILSYPMFTRQMTASLGKKRDYRREVELQAKSGHVKILMGLVDFGGPNGHRAEGGNWDNAEAVRGTRCSTTQSAVTAYFCGAQVAENQDLALGNQRKPMFSGVESFTEFITCRYNQGVQAKTHKRSVYRLGIGCKDPLAGYSHAFSIIAQPTAHFFGCNPLC